MLAALRGLLAGASPAAAVTKSLPTAVLDRLQSHSFASSSRSRNELGSSSSSSTTTTTSGTNHASHRADPYPEMPVQQHLVDKVSGFIDVWPASSESLSSLCQYPCFHPATTVCRRAPANSVLACSCDDTWVLYSGTCCAAVVA
jgi:hypothetical protein